MTGISTIMVSYEKASIPRLGNDAAIRPRIGRRA